MMYHANYRYLKHIKQVPRLVTSKYFASDAQQQQQAK
jgi:hypothetical protein